MPLKAKQLEQFIVLITGDINHTSLKCRQNIIMANNHDDILTLLETTQFNLILLDLSSDCSVASIPGGCLSHQSSQPEYITRIKDPIGINNKTPVIAVMNPLEESGEEKQFPMEFADWLIKPISEERLNEIIDFWQTKALALAYIQIILSKTNNNRRLTLTIFEKLFEELPIQIIDIKGELKNKQYDLAREITHKLNGSASFCGLIDIQLSANALENCLVNHNYADINQHFLTLEQYILSFTSHQKLILENFGKC
jgi:HPt (histidine-containing phosphotransfer) domain-containing protein